MTIGQQLVVAGMNFTIMRIMIAAAWVRLVLRKETKVEFLTTIDKALLLWVAVGAVTDVLRLGSDAIVNQMGHIYDGIGLFFIFRFSIREYEDIRSAIKALAVVAPILMLLMGVEKLTGTNPFSVFGGVPEHTIVRDGNLRVQGPFRDPILAGTFGATSVPLFAVLWYGEKGRRKFLSVAGIFSSTMIVVMSASSGPVIAYAAAIMSICLWQLRKSVRTLWYLFLIGLIILAASMKAPVWFIMARASNILGGTGWHRAELIDQAIRHFGEWWLLGTSYTAHWMPYQLGVNADMVDITNQFIAEGVSGGVFTLFAFVALVALSFKTLVAAVRTGTSSDLEGRLFWGLWGSLFCHVVTFFSVSYFDQMGMFWILLLAWIAFVRTKVFPLWIFIEKPEVQNVGGER